MSREAEGPQFVIFDLDDTLYRESDYLFNAYSSISKYISDKYVLEFEKLFSHLLNNFSSFGRVNLFNSLFEKYDIPESELNNVLGILRSCTFKEKMLLTSKGVELLNWSMSIQEKICILTNGNKEQQENKIKNLNWNGLEDYLDICYTYGKYPKPKPDGIWFFLEKYKIHRNNAVYIGDHSVDKQAAANAGISFIQINEI